jgi:sugar lactone lactonase YvrE
VGNDGTLYLPNENGTVLSSSGTKTGQLHEWAFTGGRGLGGKLDADGNLILCDVGKGLIKVDKNTKAITVLAGRVSPDSAKGPGSDIRFIDDLDIASDGTVYFSDMTFTAPVRDANGHFNVLQAHAANMLQGRPDGRLLAYYPKTQKTQVLSEGIWAANGVAVAKDESFVAIASTNSARIYRYWLKGSKKGNFEVFADSLPGFVDGISSASDGGFWAAIPAPMQSLHITAFKMPYLRWLLAWLPPQLAQPKALGLIVKVDSLGNLAEAHHCTNGKFAHITAVTEHNGKLYLGGLGLDYVATLDVPK